MLDLQAANTYLLAEIKHANRRDTIHRPFQVLVGLEQALALSWRRLGEGGVAAEQSDPRMTGGQGRPWQVIAGPWKGVEDRLDRSLGSWALGFGQQGLPRPERESGTGWGGGGRG
jgi:hypothetical protein